MKNEKQFVKTSGIGVTYDYDMFKVLVGNREVDESRVQMLMQSMKIGQLRQPILVNENGEVIDGQGRLEACRRLGLEVEYIVQAGTTREDCIRLNTNMKTWKLEDYIKSYCDAGNPQYKQLLNVMERYVNPNKRKKEYIIPIKTIVATCDLSAAGGFTGDPDYIKGGRFIMKNDIDSAIKECEYIASFKGIIPSIARAANVLLFIKRCEDIDEIKFKGKVDKFGQDKNIMKPYNNTADCLESFDNVYNYKNREKIYFKILYDAYLGKYGGKGAKMHRHKYKA